MGALDPGPVGRLLQTAMDDPALVVDQVERLSGGASRETFGLTAVHGDGASEALILQRVRAGALSASFSMEAEAELLRAAAAAGVPVPRVVTATDQPDAAGSPCMIVTRIEGEAIARKVLRDERFAVARTRVVRQCATALAATHRIAIDGLPQLRAQDPLDVTVSLLDSLGEPHPAFELAIRWLLAHRPPPHPPAVVHGDFRLGNLLVDETGLVAVLDWELAHAGDPLEDLGWFCNRAWRFGESPPVAGMGTYDELCEAYEAAGGMAVDRAALRWWEVMGSLRWGVICILQAATHLTGASRSVELATIGRRVCETEHDLLDLLGVAPDARTRAEGAPPSGAPHDRPTATELVAAVREYLESDVIGAVTGRVSFHARVAANALGMVERELMLGDAQRGAHAERMRAIGFDDDAALAAAIRSGSLDGRWDEVAATVRASVADKLAVANPAY